MLIMRKIQIGISLPRVTEGADVVPFELVAIARMSLKDSWHSRAEFRVSSHRKLALQQSATRAACGAAQIFSRP
jgi:hypothetical protein